jgi:hypothetical protein
MFEGFLRYRRNGGEAPFATCGTIIALIVALVGNVSFCDAKAPLQVGFVAEAGQIRNASR